LVEHTGSPLQIDAVLGDHAVRSAAAGFVVSPYDFMIFAFTTANSGTDANLTGIHGKLEFRVTTPDTRKSAYSRGTITASPVANDPVVVTRCAPSLHAWVQNGILHVSGLYPGKPVWTYNILGTLI